MNNINPGWNFEINDTYVTNQNKPTRLDQELVELLWQNGQVVMQSQTTHRKPSELTQVQKNDQSTLRTYGNSSSNIMSQEEDETVSWIQFPVQEDPLEQELCSNLLSELVSCDEDESYKPITRQLEDGKFTSMKPSFVQKLPENSNSMPAPIFHAPHDSSKQINDFVGGSRKVLNYSQFSSPGNVSSAPANAQFREKDAANTSQGEGRECSVMTIGSSHCGSNGVWATTLSSEPEPIKDGFHRTITWSEKGKPEMAEPTTMTSSSGGTSLEKSCSLSTANHGQKRKGKDAEESEEQSEATELKSYVGNKASHKKEGSSKRNRAAEVHNQSERRRRDRINEKMRALQQLIPNSNKTDKASMLEEAIEYLKSLQSQIQVMWMGTGMTPMVFPGIQHYMSQMSSMGMATSSLPSIHHSPMQLPRVSMPATQAPNQTMMCQNQVLSPFNYQNQLQNSCLAEQYARYMSYHLMQSASQPMNVLRYDTQAAQHSQKMIAPSNSSGAKSGAANIADAMSGKIGSSTFR